MCAALAGWVQAVEEWESEEEGEGTSGNKEGDDDAWEEL